MQQGVEVFSTPPIETPSWSQNADNKEMESGAQIDPFTVGFISLYGYLQSPYPLSVNKII